MESKRLLRITSVILLAVMLVTSLSACRLAASEGPDEAASEEYPVPGEQEEQPSDFENAATATVQAGDAGAAGGGSKSAGSCHRNTCASHRHSCSPGLCPGYPRHTHRVCAEVWRVPLLHCPAL